MKTNYLLFLSLVLFIAACNPDDEMVECEPFIDEGTISPGFAISQLPSGYIDLDADLIFVNSSLDSMIFSPNTKIEFATDKVVKTICENGDSTSHVYVSNSINKSFDSDDYTLSLSANTNFGRKQITLADGTMQVVDENCIIETLGASLIQKTSLTPTSITQRFNPSNCSDVFGSLVTNFTEVPSIELNGQTFTDVLMSKDTLFGQPVPSKLYFQNANGFIAFEDEEEVLWTLQD